MRGIQFTFQATRQMIVRNKFKDVPKDVAKRYYVLL